MKTQTKIIGLMLLVSIIGVGTPAAFSLGAGQHNFKQIDPSNPDAFCDKCHGSTDTIYAELKTSDVGIYSNMKIHSSLNCVDCHALTNGYDSIGAKTEHAATIPTCTKCHNSVMGFNVTKELNAPGEAHKNFNDDVACIGCHTSTPVRGSISYTYSPPATRSGLTIGK